MVPGFLHIENRWQGQWYNQSSDCLGMEQGSGALIPLRLRIVHSGVQAVAGHQFVVGAVLDDPAFVQPFYASGFSCDCEILQHFRQAYVFD